MSLSSKTLTVCYCQPSKIISDPRSTKLMQQPIPYHMQFDYYMLRDRNFELKANCVFSMQNRSQRHPCVQIVEIK